MNQATANISFHHYNSKYSSKQYKKYEDVISIFIKNYIQKVHFGLFEMYMKSINNFIINNILFANYNKYTIVYCDHKSIQFFSVSNRCSHSDSTPLINNIRNINDVGNKTFVHL